MKFHDFISASDEFYLYLAFQTAMFLAAFAIGWLSSWIWMLQKVTKTLDKSPREQDISLN